MKWTMLAALAVLVPSAASADAVDSAYLLCRIVDSTGFSTQPCDVSGWGGTVTAYLDMDSSNARLACEAMAAKMNGLGRHFEGRQWTLQIKSPYSGENSIAYCNLPQ